MLGIAQNVIFTNVFAHIDDLHSLMKAVKRIVGKKTILVIENHYLGSVIEGMQRAGYNSITWDATNDLGQLVSAGMYIYTIRAGEFRVSKKMLFLK